MLNVEKNDFTGFELSTPASLKRYSHPNKTIPENQTPFRSSPETHFVQVEVILYLRVILIRRYEKMKNKSDKYKTQDRITTAILLCVER